MDQKDKHGENNMLNSFKNFQKIKNKKSNVSGKQHEHLM